MMSNLLFINWDISPEIFEVGSFSIRWYGLLFASSFYLGYIIMLRIFKHENIKEEVLDSLIIYMMIGTVLGARLGHCFFYEPAYYLANPAKILMVWEGGLASHGAGIGIFTSLWIFTKKHNIPSYLWLLDRVAITVASAGVLIRLGNLMNSEIIGSITDVSWAFIFTRVDEFPRHPAQLYEAFGYAITFLFLFFTYQKLKEKTPHGFLFGSFMILIFGIRFIVEFVKEVQVDFEQDMVLNMGQILSIPMVLAGLAILIYSKRNKIA
jgi:phosphatidylglycerol---prolipoprotein diacylglyceryl transferase